MNVISNPLFPGKPFIGTLFEALETKAAMPGELTRGHP